MNKKHSFVMVDAEDLFSVSCAGHSPFALLNPLSLFLSDYVPWKMNVGAVSFLTLLVFTGDWTIESLV